MPRSRAELLDRCYAAIEVVRARVGGPRLLSQTSSRAGWPDHGVFLLFEEGERRSDGVTPRVTFVGSHGLEEGSPVLLWTRLAQHRGSVAGPNPGAGNHRRSELRRLLGAALLASDDRWSSAAATWGSGDTASRAVRMAEAELEREVSRRIGDMPLLWVEVADRQQRAAMVAGLIATLSERPDEPVDPPSATWLGRCAPEAAVRASGLWHVEHADAGPDPAAVASFRAHAGVG
ncbi:MAG: hypothetical protein EA340_07710 [Nitriliruptor sp.]|nr:MAG: hypothetical protein EA340_07710 [Nitriliruptor sp.]